MRPLALAALLPLLAACGADGEPEPPTRMAPAAAARIDAGPNLPRTKATTGVSVSGYATIGVVKSF